MIEEFFTIPYKGFVYEDGKVWFPETKVVLDFNNFKDLRSLYEYINTQYDAYLFQPNVGIDEVIAEFLDNVNRLIKALSDE